MTIANETATEIKASTREPREGDGLLCIMDHTGDTRLIWDPRNDEEVENARASFDRLKKKGFIAYAVNTKTGEKGEVITAFDPKAEKIIMAQPLKGG